MKNTAHRDGSAPSESRGQLSRAEPAVSLENLLPVIRSNRVVDPFWSHVNNGVAVYRGSLVIFHQPSSYPLPDEVFVEDEGAALVSCRSIRRVRRFTLAEIKHIKAVMQGAHCKFSLRAGGKSHKFVLLRQESRHVVAALEQLSGVFHFVDDSQGWDAPSRCRGSVLSCVLIALCVAGFCLLGSVQGKHHGNFPAAIRPWLLLGLFLPATYLLNRWVTRPNRREPKRLPWRSLTLSWVLRLVGLLLVAVGYVSPLSVCAWLLGLDLVDGDAAGYTLAAHAMNYLLIGGGVCLLYVGYRLGLGLAGTLLDQDARPPVLYLRSFDDDGLHSLTPRIPGTVGLGLRPWPLLECLGPFAHAHPLRLLRLALGRAVDTSEEQLAVFFEKIGPFVAVGRPGETLVTGGAARNYVDNHRWRSEVAQWLRAAAFVVVQPAETAGIWQELRFVRKKADPKRVLMSMANFHASEQRYEEFRLRFEHYIGHALPRNIRTVAFLRFDAEWKPILVRPVFHSPFLWPLTGTAVHLDRTLQPFLREAYSGGKVAPPSACFRLPDAGTLRSAGIIWGLAVFALAYALTSTIGASMLNRQSITQLNRAPFQEFYGPGSSYRWRLGRDWKTRRDFWPETTVYARGRFAFARVTCTAHPATFGDSQKTMDAYRQKRTGHMERGETQTIRFLGRSWLQETKTKGQGDNLVLEVVRCYDGPDVQCILDVEMFVGDGSAWDQACAALNQLLDGFELPPFYHPSWQ